MEEARVAEATVLLERLEAWTKAADKERLEGAFAKVIEVHNALQTKRVREKLQAALGDVLGTEDCGSRTRMLAADAMGRLNDPKGVWKELKKHLPDDKDPAVGPVPLRVIQAVGALAPESAIPTLEKLMEKAKDANVSRHAVQALGKYGWSRRRTKVLDSIAEYLRRLRPGGTDPRKGRAGGEAARARFDLLQTTIVAALRELTGRKEYTSVDQWLEAWKEHKKRPQELFTFER